MPRPASAVCCLLSAVCGLLLGACGPAKNAPRELRIFHAAGFSPVIEAVRADVERDLNLRLLAEGSGSQVAARKITDLRRPCDLIILADNALPGRLLSSVCDGRVDFATDEIVLGVGIRAPHVPAAETDWVPVLLRPEVRFGRADENQAPLGYRTIMVWQLEEARRQARTGNPETPATAPEQRNAPGAKRNLTAALMAKCVRVADDAARLAPLLRAGELDYAFVYRSTCLAADLRFITLDTKVNLGSADTDYSAATVTFQKLKSGTPENVSIRGGAVCWTLCIPTTTACRADAIRFSEYLLTRQPATLAKYGLRALVPARYYGTKTGRVNLESFTQYCGGEL